MIICMCRRINESGVREAIRCGAKCPDSVQAHHGSAFNCGRCRSQIGEMIVEEVERDDYARVPVPAE